VLAGYAHGNFFSVFIHDAFPDLPKGKSFGVVISPSKGGGGSDGRVIFYLLNIKKS
jgi:hypothetical protein